MREEGVSMVNAINSSAAPRGGFAQRVLYHRCRLGWTQAQLAERIGISRAAICTYETMTSEPTLTVLVRLARVLGVTTDHLLGVEESGDPR